MQQVFPQLLSYFSMHLGYIELEKVCISLMKSCWLPTTRCNVHNLAQQVQTPLSQKQKTFCQFFIAFPKCAWNLEHFEKKDEYPSLIISEIMDCERGGYLNV